MMHPATAYRRHAMPFGATLLPEGGVCFRLWAPGQAEILLALDGAEPLPLQAGPDGWHELTVADAKPGDRYRFLLPNGQAVPDPASRHQPDGVHGPSEVTNPAAYHWQEANWQGRPWHEAVIYELHIGSFTPEGTFRAAIEKLDHLVKLGVTALEIMPVAAFPGTRGWGYDGVLPYAPAACYGRPDDFKALIDAAHARGLMVLLDVVYNHFGPEGNYLPLYAPGFFTDAHKTPWGDAINVDGPDAKPVREFFIHNALYWIEEFNLDGLRLDAVHAIHDDSPRHLLDELAGRVRAAAGPRPVHLILENEENEARRLGHVFTAQWNDDVHHGLHVAVTGEDAGYYADYHGDIAKLARALAEGFAFQGEVMAYRGSPRGEPSAHLPPSRFVSFLQNHDQVGNRAFGDRIHAIAPEPAIRAAACLYLLAPQIPMLFMGEEWGATSPFPFFCDLGADLKEAVREGRRQEFARFPAFQDADARARIPDPTDEATFLSAKLDWAAAERGPWLDWYSTLLTLRRREIIPLLPGIPGNAGQYRTLGTTGLMVEWRLGDGGMLALAANLGPEALSGFSLRTGRELWVEGTASDTGTMGPWSVRWVLVPPAPAEGEPNHG